LPAPLSVIDSTPAASRPRRAPLSGSVPLLPAQHRFFEREDAAAHHFNQAVLLAPRRRLDAPPLEQAARSLVVQHDSLRARFASEGGVWRQVIDAPEVATDFRVELIDLRDAGSEERARAALGVECARLQAGLRPGSGSLVAAALFELGGGLGQRLFV